VYMMREVMFAYIFKNILGFCVHDEGSYVVL
jgi:hypothetical protein